MTKILWHVEMVDGGDFKLYERDLYVEGGSNAMLEALLNHCNDMAPNSIRSLAVKYVRTIWDEDE